MATRRGQHQSVPKAGVEGQTAPDYALNLGAIAKELQVVVARLDAIEASPQLQATPADVALQIRQEAGRLAARQKKARRRAARATTIPRIQSRLP